MGSDCTLSKTTARAFRVGARLTGTTRKVFIWRTGLAWPGNTLRAAKPNRV